VGHGGFSLAAVLIGIFSRENFLRKMFHVEHLLEKENIVFPIWKNGRCSFIRGASALTRSFRVTLASAFNYLF